MSVLASDDAVSVSLVCNSKAVSLCGVSSAWNPMPRGELCRLSCLQDLWQGKYYITVLSVTIKFFWNTLFKKAYIVSKLIRYKLWRLTH